MNMQLQALDRHTRTLNGLAYGPEAPHPGTQLASLGSFQAARTAWERAGLKAAEGERALRKHRERQAAHDEPAPRPIWKRWLLTELGRAYAACGYRRAQHGHSFRIRLDQGVSVSSEAHSVHPSKVGLPNAYSKKAYFVTSSEHTVSVDRHWCRNVRARGAAVVAGLLTLDLDLSPTDWCPTAYVASWVEQARGTKLRLVHGYLVQTASGWKHATTIPGAKRIASES